MSARADIPLDTIERQRKASDPATSAWVSANAGSGKTHVLTQRVLRLLLAGVAPARILCLTFTKAAAANMAIRVFESLAAWTRLDDAALAAAILETGAPRPSATDLDSARRLFARTVETPGGLKIQTIHAFCERLLHLFPFEANVAARFEVMDDLMQQDLLGQARLDVLTNAMADEAAPLGHAIAVLAAATSATGFEDLLAEMLSQRDLLGDAADVRPDLARALGIAPDDTVAAVEAAMIGDGLRPTEWGELARRLGADGSEKNTVGNRLAAAALAAPGEVLPLYLAVFLTKTLEERADSYIPAAVRRGDPALAGRLDAERSRLSGLLDRRRAAAVLDRTVALVTVADAILRHYEAGKRQRGLLDFDDLIERTLTLLERAGSAWVLYKLDAGIDHVLVDEAQDTSPGQWRILRAITADFFVGAGGARAGRSFFAVGDEKQSIFSFQGARPAMFDAMRRAFETDTRDGRAAFARVPLTLSFRSTGAILETVDRIFAAGDHAAGLTAPGEPLLPHEPLRRSAPGMVELWPPVGPTPVPEPRDWRLPLDQAVAQAPPMLLARRIADTIARLTAPNSGETVAERGGGRRPMRPGDVMILVRSRNAFFDAMIRALKDRGVPVAGADRLELTEHIAVMDLVAAGRAALLPEDDLTLACVLKSPLMGLDDDDLIALAPERRGTLTAALAASDMPAHKAAAARLLGWQRRAATTTPFAFYAALLGAEGGRRAMLERLGPEAGDALDEFIALTLTHAKEGPPSLLAFLGRLEGQTLSIKRDMEAAGNAVRVMTVHAAKGLEAKVVVLPDTCGAPAGQHDPKIFALPAGRERVVPAWSPRRDADPQPLSQVRQALRQAEIEESRRLLYVALTRAEERLIIAGFHGTKGMAQGCWYGMIAASDLGLDEVPAPWDGAETILQRRDPGLDGGGLAEGAAIEPTAAPPWLTQAPPHEIAYAPPIRPSSALAAADQQPLEAEGFDIAERNPGRRRAALVGQLAHRLLQHLPALPADRRAAAAARFVDTQGQGLDVARRTALADAVMAVIDHPDLAALFGTGSRAEVGIAGSIAAPDGRRIDIAGQIDRIAVTDDAVLLADFKTGRPHTLDSVPESYVAQLALYREAVGPLYPSRRTRALLVWTQGPVVLELPEGRLDAALGGDLGGMRAGGLKRLGASSRSG